MHIHRCKTCVILLILLLMNVCAYHVGLVWHKHVRYRPILFPHIYLRWFRS